MTRNEKLNRKAIEYSLAIKDFMVMHGAKEESAKTIAKIMQLAYMAGAAEADVNSIKEIDDLLLEKQSEQNSIINVPPKEVIRSIWYLGYKWKELTNGSISTEHGTQLDYIQKHWHEREYYLIEKQSNESKKVTYIQEVEVGNANIIDKVEPKFKVGDWVVCEVTSSVYQIKHCIENLSNHKYGYELIDGGYIGSDEVNNYHLWTIADAKDGDVLANSKVICIYKKRKAKHVINTHITYSIAESVGEIDDTIADFNLYPALQEVRELLFQKMKELGYKWDVENKELKKINKV